MITSSGLDQTEFEFCVGDVLTFTAAGTNLPAGDVIDWHISQTSGFNPYNSEGTSIGTSNITPGPCGTPAEILYLMVNPDNAQVGSGDDRCDEFIIIYTGSGGFTPNNIVVSNLAGPPGDNIWDNFVAGNTSTFNCGTALNPNDPVPANAILVIQANPFNNVSIDLGALCSSGLPVFIIAYNTDPSCVGGYLDNSNGGGCASCPVMLSIDGTCDYMDDFNYTPPASSVDGWGVSNLLGGGAYGDMVPQLTIPVLQPAPGIVTPFVYTIQPNFCTTFGSGTFYITGVLNPAPTGVCMDIFTAEFEIQVSCPTATLTGDITVCSANCPDDPGEIAFDFSGGTEPYMIDVVVTATGFPTFPIPGVVFGASGHINLCIGGFLPSYDPGTQTLTVPDFLIGQQVTITLLSIVDDEGCVGVVQPPGSLVITLFEGPSADAGIDITACPGSPANLNGSIGDGAQSFDWLTSGDGFIADPSSLQTSYVPGANDIMNGSVTITLVAFEPNGVCEPDSSSIVITFLDGPGADAGSDQTICVDDMALLDGSISGSAISSTWTTSGDGSFSNILDPNSTYTPGTNDINASTVTLYLTTDNAGGQCDAAVDSMLLTLVPPPVISGPMLGSVCIGDLAFLPQVVMGNVGAVMWTTSGDGMFDNPSAVSTFYAPGNQDTTNGGVTLTLTVISILNICDPVQFVFTLTLFNCVCPDILSSDSVNPLCNFEGQFDVATLVADPGGMWQITATPPGGDPALLVGTVFDAHNADPGLYTLTYALFNPIPNCPTSASITIDVIEAPKLDAGFDLFVCASSPVNVIGQVTGSTGAISWTSSGTGTFSDPTELTPTYTPSASDLDSGSILVIISGTDTSAACPIAFDSAVITFETPVAMLINDAAMICNDSAVGSIINFYDFVAGGDTSGIWVSLSGTPIDVSDPENVDFDEIGPGTYLFAYSANADPPCTDVRDTVSILVVACICPQLNVNPLPSAVCNSDPGVNLDAFVTATQPGSWSLASVPPGVMPATLVGSFINTLGADAGVYEVLFSFNNHVAGCPDSAILEVVVLPVPLVLTGGDTIICSTDDVQLTGLANTGVTILEWSSAGDGTFNDSAMLSTIYTPGPADILNGSVVLTLTGGDTSGVCNASMSILTLTIQPEPFAVFDTTFISVCNIQDSGSIVDFIGLIISGDNGGTWIDINSSGADMTDLTQVNFDGVVPGMYQFRYSTTSAIVPCVNVDYLITVEVVSCLCPDLLLVNVPTVICNNDTINLAVLLNTPQLGSWQLDNINGLPLPPVVFGDVLDVSGSSAGTYLLVFNLTNPVTGCLSTTDFSFTVEATPIYSIVDLNCRIASAVYDAILVTDAETIVTNFGTIVQGNADTIFIEDIPVDQDISVTMTSLSGCITNASISAPDCNCSLEILNVPDTVQFCAGDTFSVTAMVMGDVVENAYWLTQGDTVFGTDIEIIAGGTYVFFVEAENGCTASVELIATEFSALIPDIQFFDPLCPGGTEGSIFIQGVSGATLPLMYSVNGGIFELVDTTIWAITTLGAGDYFLVIEDVNGCQATASITLDDALGETLDLGPDLIIDSGDSILVDPNISFIPDVFMYSPALLDSLLGWITPIQNTILALEAIDSRGCVYQDTLLITVRIRDEVFAPNVFSPNGDQINDRWTIYAADSQARIRMLNIYDRWGGLRYSQPDLPVNDPNVGWDGTSKGEELNPGVYVFHATVALSSGDIIIVSGDITLIK